MRPAFTLIELLVVITIVALLAAMLMPAIGFVRDAAQSTRCQSNMRQLGLCMLAYPTEWEGLLPPAVKDWSNYNASGADRGSCWQILRDTGFLPGIKSDADDYQLSDYPYLRCPAKQRQGMNYSQTFHYSVTDALLGSRVNGDQLPIARVHRSANLILSSDVAGGSFSWFPSYMSPGVSWCSPGNFVGWNAPHKDATNWVFADGHVEGAKYRGDYQAQGSAYKAISNPSQYTKSVTDNQASMPADDDFFWSRQQNDQL